MRAGSGARRLWRQLERRLRVVGRDLFGDGQLAAASLASGAGAEDPQALLDQAEAQLAELRQAWAAALARTHQADQDWQAARQAVERQDAAVDAALRAGQEPAARARQRELNAWQARCAGAEQRRAAEAGLLAQLAEAVQSLAAQLAAARQQLATLEARRQGAAAREQLQRLRETVARPAPRAPEERERLP